MNQAQHIAQWAVACLLVISFFSSIKGDVEGKPAKPPAGFKGIMSTTIAFAIVTAIYWLCGTFSKLP